MPLPASVDGVLAGSGRPRVVAWWLAGLVLVVAVVLVASHRVEERGFVLLVERARPGWLLVAALLQGGTYFAEALLWWTVLDRAGTPRPLRALVGLSVAKLFVDQALPSGGISGSLLVVRGLERRSVPRATSLAVVLVAARAYYAAYLTALVVALALLATHERLTRSVLVPAAVFAALVLAFVDLVRRALRGECLGGLERTQVVRRLRALLAAASTPVLQGRGSFVSCWGLQCAVFALDGSTLGALLHAVGGPLQVAPVVVAFMLASLARTMGPVPGGLGTFEAVAVATLHAGGVSVAAALAATLLFRGFSFWLPLLPGLLLVRREARGAPRPA